MLGRKNKIIIVYFIFTQFVSGMFLDDTLTIKKLNFIIESGIGMNTYVQYINRRATGFYSDYDVINCLGQHFLMGIRYNLDKKRKYLISLEMGSFKGKYKQKIQVGELFYLNDSTLLYTEKKNIYTTTALIPFLNLTMAYCFKNYFEIGIKGTLYSRGYKKVETLTEIEKFLYKYNGQNIYIMNSIGEENSYQINIYNNLSRFNTYNMHNFSLYVNKGFKVLKNKTIGIGINYLISYVSFYYNISLNINFQL